MIQAINVADKYEVAILALMLTYSACIVLWKIGDMIEAATAWIKHDLKMRRGGRE